MLEKRRSRLLALLFVMAVPASGQNFSISTTILNTTSAEITNFSIVTGGAVDFLFTVHNVGNTNISVFPEITVYDSNDNAAVQLVYNTQVNMSAGSLKDLKLSWNTGSSGNFTAKLIVFYDNNARWATASKTFLLLPASASATPITQGNSGGGGSSGGEGSTSKEPYSNILMWEIREGYLQKDVSTSFKFTSPGLGISEVLITPAESFGIVSVKIEQLKGLSKIEGIIQPQGIIYKNININIAGEAARQENIKYASIKFKVENNWLADNNLNAGTIRLLKWDGSKWILLETALESRDKKFVYYEAKTSAFSPFAIVGIANSEVFIQPTATVITTSASTEVQNETLTSIFAGILGFALPRSEATVNPFWIIVLGIIVALLFIMRRRGMLSYFSKR